MELDTRFVYTIALLILLAVLIMLVLRITKLFKERSIKELSTKEDDRRGVAYSALSLTQGIMEHMGEKGRDTTKAKELIAQARQDYAMGSYETTIQMCERIRDMLKEHDADMSNNQEIVVVHPETRELEAPIIPETFPGKKDISTYEGGADETIMPEKESEERNEQDEVLKELQEEAMGSIKDKDNRLPAKFTMARAREFMEEGSKAGRDMTEAEEEMRMSEEAFNREEYDVALSRANRARKMACGEPVEETLQAPRATQDQLCPECGRTLDKGGCENCGITVVQVMECLSCGEEVGEEDVFCRHCGEKLVEEKAYCKKCGADIPSDSNFCPKCGTKRA